MHRMDEQGRNNEERESNDASNSSVKNRLTPDCPAQGGLPFVFSLRGKKSERACYPLTYPFTPTRGATTLPTSGKQLG